MFPHLDLPDRHQIDRLMNARRAASVSIYMPTDPALGRDSEPLHLRNLVDEAVRQLRAADHDKREIDSLAALVTELIEDGDFWEYQARSLAVFVTPDDIATYRLPHALSERVAVSDRFHVKPLLRALTFPASAYVLALSENAVRVVEVLPEGDPEALRIPNMPKDAVDAVGVTSIGGRELQGRAQGGEGRKMRLGQYSRAVDHALRPQLIGRDVPLILATTKPMDAIYRQWNSYPHLVEEFVEGNPETTTDHDLAVAARKILDVVHARELEAVKELFASRTNSGRSATDVADVARFATYGMVDTLFVDIDAALPGAVDEESGAVTFAAQDDAETYGVVDEITRRVWLAGGRILAVRHEDVPGGGDLAAILRWVP